ncbi:hypothetical protein NDU88_005431 [Pleurodeles waltl]|uniref:Uncharacterized protein n=1 Tax=Pleurodeles waltl TaxID=8319 RepID=A0AAV7QJ12_PLEWA|nr:hypothetical protein NDU88_005431 [Pleurodeles waltl]
MSAAGGILLGPLPRLARPVLCLGAACGAWAQQRGPSRRCRRAFRGAEQLELLHQKFGGERGAFPSLDQIGSCFGPRSLWWPVPRGDLWPGPTGLARLPEPGPPWLLVGLLVFLAWRGRPFRERAGLAAIGLSAGQALSCAAGGGGVRRPAAIVD